MSKKHLSLDDRVRIQHYLEDGRSIRYIADRLDRSPSTISREINKHISKQMPKLCDCTFFSSCTLKHVCGNKVCNKPCRTCVKAPKLCSDYARSYCDTLLDTTSGVCNSCDKLKTRKCHFESRYYDASVAQAEYQDKLINSRNGYDCTAKELQDLDDLISPLIKNGQSIYHIMQNHKDEILVSESTIRRMIHATEFDCRNIDMRSVVQRKVRPRRKHDGYKKSAVNKEGRLYSDYLEYIKIHEDISVVEMDCVEGSKDSSATLLTLHFVQFHMQLAIIMDEQTSEEVIKALDKIETALGKELFAQCFNLILTDNGHEFEDIKGMERSYYGGKRTNLFFCEPNRSDEKGSCETNHKLIRYVIPKGTNMDPYNQIQITLMMNHINSYCRESLFGKCPYDIAMAVMPEDFFILLGLEKIPADEVLLRPSLINRI